MASNNSLLIALALVERAVPQLKPDKREQVNRITLSMVQTNLSRALNIINEVGIDDAYIIGNLIDVVDCIDELTKSDDYIETDTETKEIIVNKVNDCLNRLYIETGKYYTTHDFDYSIRMEPTLIKVIDNCIKAGYYFGYSV